MSALSLPSQVACSRHGAGPHPVPRGSRLDDAQPLFKRAAAISLALHTLLVAICLAITYWQRDELVGIPQEQILDVTIVPLSALDTLLPKGEPDRVTPVISSELDKRPEPEITPATPTKSESPKKIIPASTLKLKDSLDRSTNEDSSKRSRDSEARESNSTGKLGTANGADISLEQARISYQDMVATLIARAKRYPERALKRRMSGEGSIRLEISSDGSLANVEILRSTETQILDEELKAMAERAAPFPAFPNDLRKNKLALIVPIAFRLES